jgi:hypothetical protein
VRLHHIKQDSPRIKRLQSRVSNGKCLKSGQEVDLEDWQMNRRCIGGVRVRVWAGEDADESKCKSVGEGVVEK